MPIKTILCIKVCILSILLRFRSLCYQNDISPFFIADILINGVREKIERIRDAFLLTGTSY